MLDDLSRAREGFVLASDLHLVYLVTPINVEVEPDWELYYERFMQLSSLEQVHTFCCICKTCFLTFNLIVCTIFKLYLFSLATKIIFASLLLPEILNAYTLPLK